MAITMDKPRMVERLCEPFPTTALRTRSGGGGKQLTYVEGHTVIHRLNAATENQWNFSVDKIERTEIDAQNAMLMAYVTLEIPGLGKRSHIGVQAVSARGGEDLVKGAVTDALKKAATLFGVGLELYGPDYEAGEIGNAPQTRSDGPGATTPPRARSTTTNTVPADANTVTAWTDFWNEVERMGLPRDSKDFIAKTGIQLGANPALALEKAKAWHHDNATQQGVPF